MEERCEVVKAKNLAEKKVHVCPLLIACGGSHSDDFF